MEADKLKIEKESKAQKIERLEKEIENLKTETFEKLRSEKILSRRIILENELREKRISILSAIISQESEILKIEKEEIVFHKQREEKELHGLKKLEFMQLKKELSVVNQNDREQILTKWCEENEKFGSIEREPLPTSITKICNNAIIFKSLNESDTSKGFLDTTEEAEIVEIGKQIENIHGYNPLTSQSKVIKYIKLQSYDIDISNILFKNHQEVINKFKQDLSSFYDIPKDLINVLRVVPGSLEFYFTISGDRKIASKDNIEFNSIKSLFNNSKSSKFNVSQKDLLPNKEQAIKALKDYTKPLIINTKSTSSEIFNKFSRYLGLFATLNSRVRVTHNQKEDKLEIHGPPSERGAILNYFAELEDLLSGDNLDKVIIIPFQTKTDLLGFYDGFLSTLYKKAKDFAVSSCFGLQKLQYHTLKINPNLKMDCPAFEKFLNALRKSNLDPKSVNFEKILNRGVFGWHGTRSSIDIPNIAWYGLDPRKRKKNLLHGQGEYCAENPNYSIDSGYWGDTNTLFLFFILKIAPFYKFQIHHVVNNPLDSDEMYMVPILVATFNNQIPWELSPKFVNYSPQFNWEWLDESGWVLYGEGQPIEKQTQVIIESMYQKFQKEQIYDKFVLSLVRLNNKATDAYEIDLLKMRQTNKRTSFSRNIRRVPIKKENFNLIDS